MEVGQNVAVEVALKIGSVKEGVQVRTAADILHATDASGWRPQAANSN